MDTSTLVFISYTHDSEQHKEKALSLANRLNEEGLDCWIDRYVEDSTPERGWPMWMEEKVRTSKFVLVVGSANYLARYEGRAKSGEGLGAKFESVLATQWLYENEMLNTKFIPVIFDGEDKDNIPFTLRPYSRYNLEGNRDYESLYRRLTDQAKIKKPSVGRLVVFTDKDSSSQASSQQVIIQADTNKSEVVETFIPNIPELVNEMKPGLKIVQAFFKLPILERFSLAQKLELLKEGESYKSNNTEEIFTNILLRAKENNKMFELWELLFDSQIDPNPFK